ncbi:MAG: hypothetical protein J6S14_15485 [Clostridia bacterium]|nr:hypothetical protein [Clostridia bacterium]
MTNPPTFPIEPGQSIYAIPQGNAEYHYRKNTILRFIVEKTARKYFYVSDGPHRIYKFELDTYRYADRMNENQDFLLFPTQEAAERYITNRKMESEIRHFFYCHKDMPPDIIESIYHTLASANLITPINEKE